MSDYYKVGGSLRFNHPTYITRQADREIYRALKQREFCYVLNSRQMGKSSLRVRTMKTLAKEGFKCVAIDLGILGRFTAAEQWYGGLLAELWRKLRLSQGIDDDLEWWRSHSELSPVQRFSRFIEDVLLVNCSADIIVFLDEIDNVIKLDFRDEFFSLIRNCYEQRVESEQYRRLTFCLLGVATPSSLRIDKQLSPFNIGCGIELTGFNFTESQPLLLGLSGIDRPKAVLQEILTWTKGQPFLTQKLCALVARQGTEPLDLPRLIQQRLIDNWEIQDEPEHLKTIRDRLLHYRHRARLLTLYDNVLRHRQIAIDNPDEQVELRLSGLVTRQQGKLTVSNPIYERVFNRQWVTRQLSAIAPYQNALAAWLKSQSRDDSRLLRGEALIEGLMWAKKHSITNDERNFLRESELLAIEEDKQARLARKAEYVAKELAREKRLVRWQSLFILFSLAMLGGFYLKSRQANLSNIAALVRSSEALFVSNQKLDALMAAIAAKQKLNQALRVNQELTQQVDTALQQVVYQIEEKNRLLGHEDRLYSIAISQDREILATSATDNTVRIWKRGLAGWQLHRILKHDGWVLDVAISHQLIASASRDRTVKLWNFEGELIDTLQHSSPVTSVAVRGEEIFTGTENGDINIWRSGKLIETLTGHSAAVEAIAITPERKIVSASEDKTIKIWHSGKLMQTLTGHTEGVRALAVNADGSRIVSGSRDKTLKIWDSNGTEIATLKGHSAPVYGVAVAGDRIVSASGDKTLKIWDNNGTEIATLKGHTDRVWDVTYLGDNSIASVSWDKTVRIWQPDNLIKTLSGHQDVAIALDYQDDLIASASDDKTVKLWNSTGTLLQTFREHTAEVYDVAIANNTIASVGADRTLRIWQRDDNRLNTIKAHNSAIWAVDISSDGRQIVTAGNDRFIKIWDLEGNLLQSWQGHTQKIWDLAFSPNNQQIVSASEDNTLKVWDLEGNLLHTLQGHQDAVRTVTISGKQIISAGEDRAIKIWDLLGRAIATLDKHDAAIKAVALSPNQQYLASVDDAGKLIIWQRSDRQWQPQITLRTYNNTWSIAFSPNSNTIATAGEDGKITLWNIDTILRSSPLQYGCNWIDEYLHSSEIESGDRYLCYGLSLN